MTGSADSSPEVLLNSGGRGSCVYLVLKTRDDVEIVGDGNSSSSISLSESNTLNSECFLLRPVIKILNSSWFIVVVHFLLKVYATHGLLGVARPADSKSLRLPCPPTVAPLRRAPA